MDIRAIKRKIQNLQKALLKSTFCKITQRVTSSKYQTPKTERAQEKILLITIQMHQHKLEITNMTNHREISKKGKFLDLTHLTNTMKKLP